MQTEIAYLPTHYLIILTVLMTWGMITIHGNWSSTLRFTHHVPSSPSGRTRKELGRSKLSSAATPRGSFCRRETASATDVILTGGKWQNTSPGKWPPASTRQPKRKRLKMAKALDSTSNPDVDWWQKCKWIHKTLRSVYSSPRCWHFNNGRSGASD